MLLIENTHSTDKQTTPKMMCRCEFHIFTGVSGHFAEILPSKQHPLQWLPSSPWKTESINIPVTPRTDGQVTSSQSLTVPFSVNALSDHTSLCSGHHRQTSLGFWTEIPFQKCKLLPSVGHVTDFRYQDQTTGIMYSCQGQFKHAVLE